MEAAASIKVRRSLSALNLSGFGFGVVGCGVVVGRGVVVGWVVVTSVPLVVVLADVTVAVVLVAGAAVVLFPDVFVGGSSGDFNAFAIFSQAA